LQTIGQVNVKGAKGWLFNTQRQIADRYLQLGDFNQAEVYVRRNQALLQEARGWPTYGNYRRPTWEFQTEFGKARLFEARGQYREAEASYKGAEGFQ
jgi:tetratricopeptide (TPR) repeat protein